MAAPSSSTPLAPPPEHALRLLAPRGVLRAAINLANTILAQRGAGEEPQGAAMRMAKTVAERLGVPLQPVLYASAGQVAQAAADDAWDLGFLAIDKARAESVGFTRPYLLIDSTYLVRADGPRTPEAVDVAGLRIATARGAAYELHLARELRHATLVRTATPAEALGLFRAGDVDAVAGVRQALEGFARDAGGQVLAGCFQQVQHAMAVPRRAEAALPWLDTALNELKHTGFLRQAMVETGQADATLAP